MKKIIVIITLFITMFTLTGCANNESKSQWPDNTVLEYTKGSIVAIKQEADGYDIKIDSTSMEDYNNYVEALKALTYEEYPINEYDDDIKWYGTNNNRYLEIEYIPSTDEDYEGYNLEIEINNSKPYDWD